MTDAGVYNILSVHPAMIKQNSPVLAILVLAFSPFVAAQQSSDTTEKKPDAVHRMVDSLFNYLNMAGTTKASEFQPLTQPERTKIYLKTMVNPVGYLKAGFSAGIDQWNHK